MTAIISAKNTQQNRANGNQVFTNRNPLRTSLFQTTYNSLKHEADGVAIWAEKTGCGRRNPISEWLYVSYPTIVHIVITIVKNACKSSLIFVLSTCNRYITTVIKWASYSQMVFGYVLWNHEKQHRPEKKLQINRVDHHQI